MTAQLVLQHHDTGKVWPASAGAGLEDLAAAYQAALAVRALRQARGEVPRGCKIGFTNRGLWPRYQVFAPIWGSLWGTTFSFGVSAASLLRARLSLARSVSHGHA
jgi:2-keto-4-pentenoate hydratase